MQFKKYIAGALWTGCLLLVVLIVSGALWGILTMVGDNIGAQVARGIALVTLVCWLLNLVTLVVLTALGQLESTAEPPERRVPSGTGPGQPASSRPRDEEPGD